MTDHPVPFLNLADQHRELAAEVREAVDPLFESAMFIGGPVVEGFESAFSQAQGSPYCVSLKSGTAAIHLGLQALGVGPGDEVIVPAYTFIATAAPVVHLGATPIFVDVDEETACMDPQAVEAAISPRTKAIIPVHLYGHPAPLGPLLEVAGDIPIVEDCAQSHLALYNGQPVGTLGALGTFSFYPGKNLGAAGDGGAVTTSDRDLAERIRSLANHGRTGRYEHGELGWNERMDAVQAAVLGVKLKHLPGWTDTRRRAAENYQGLLEGAAPYGKPLRLPVTRSGAEPAFHLYVIRHRERDKLAEALTRAGIATGVHYPGILPQQAAFADLGLGEGSFPIAEAWTTDCLAIPLFPGITQDQQAYVADTIRSL